MKNDLVYPRDLVIRMRGMVDAFNAHTLEKYQKEGNLYFHLNIECLRKKYPCAELTEVATSDEVFLAMTKDHMEVLHSCGFLEALTRKKEN